MEYYLDAVLVALCLFILPLYKLSPYTPNDIKNTDIPITMVYLAIDNVFKSKLPVAPIMKPTLKTINVTNNVLKYIFLILLNLLWHYNSRLFCKFSSWYTIIPF